jgi:beta-lactamase regulating signal transducer with metallopeptidase domain
MTTADALAWLLTYALHSTLLLGGVWLLTERGGVRSHRLRDLFWKTALVGGIVTATAQTVLQRADWTPRFVPATTSAVVIAPGELPMPMPVGIGRRAASTEASDPAPAIPMSILLITAWALVAAAGLTRLVTSHRRFSQRLGRREPVRSLPVLTLLEDLLVASGTTTRVRLTRSDALGSPVALGVSEICVPGAVLSDLEPAQQRGVLAHELAHLRRRDPLWLIGAGLLERIFFFQPLNRVARVSIQESAEYLCDDWAARTTGSGLTVAKSLVKVAEWVRGTPAAVPLAGMAERPSQLVGRVRRLTERGRPAERRMRWAIPAAAAILLVTAFAAPGIATNRPGSLVEDSADGGALFPADYDTESATDQEVQAAPDPKPEPKPRSVMASLQNLKVGVSLNFDGNKADASALDTLGLAALIAALRDSDAGVRRAAAHSLGNIESPRATEPLIAVLRDSDAEVRQNAAWALGNIEDRRAVEGLIGALRDESHEVRNSAAWALGNLEDPRAADALTAALKDESAEVRKSAAWALGQLELTTAPAALIEAMRDSDAEVREAAIDAVAQTGDQRAVPNLAALIQDNSPDVRHSAISALSQMRGAPAMQALIDAMKSSDPEVRREAADALGDRD